jgi:hypothetical protein
MTFERDANTVRFLDDVWFVVRPSGNERNNGTWLTVRAVAFSESAGNYSVYQCEDGKRLWIAYGCLGHRGNLARTPLRIHVQKVPIEIFVSARAAM